MICVALLCLCFLLCYRWPFIVLFVMSLSFCLRTFATVCVCQLFVGRIRTDIAMSSVIFWSCLKRRENVRLGHFVGVIFPILFNSES